MSFNRWAAKLVPFDWNSIEQTTDDSHPLAPLFETGGLVFPITPNITETIAVDYDQVDIAHSNEAYNVYRKTQNRNINLGNLVFPCDNEKNARYALAAIHFIRTYSLMDFGRDSTGRPPSPMKFTALGKYSFDETPVIFKGASITHSDAEIDLIQALNPGASGNGPDDFTYLPAKLSIGDISLTVQHSPNYWRGYDADENFTLEDFRNGNMIRNR